MNLPLRPEILTITVFAIFSLLTQSVAAADFILGIADNTDPAPDFPGAISSAPFATGKEWRFVAPDGMIVHHDLTIGTDKWIFDDVTGEMKGVTGTEPTSGSENPETPCPAGCDGLTQNNSFFAADLGLVAPVTGSPAGIEYGPARLVGTDTFGPFYLMSITFPVLELQWHEMSVFLGKAGDAGVTFYCVGTSPPDAACMEARCIMEHTIQETEHSGFAGFTIQMDLPVFQVPPCG
ncbi:MAG: hypothetical protein PVJ66_05230 [Gammaproteobacteria bacterium]|jgi:hypothetical protein